MTAKGPSARRPRAGFLSEERAVQSWYVLARSEEVKPGAILTRTLLSERIAVYRSENGTAHALLARCPHMGADLGKGRVRGDFVECAFHRWAFGPDGRCHERGRKNTFSYPCVERYGLVWIFNGPEPLFAIPDFSGYDFVRMPSSQIQAHPHLLAANGLDVAHFESVHGLKFHGNPQPQILDPYRMQVNLQIDLTRPGVVFRALRLLAGDTAFARFTTVGSNLATIHAKAGPVPIYVLFTHRPAGPGSHSQTLFFFPSPGLPAGLEQARRVLAYLIMFAILRDDVDLLSNLDFREDGLLKGEPMNVFRSHVNQMETFRASDS